MSFADCIRGKGASKLIRGEHAEEAAKFYEATLGELRRSMPEGDAQAIAAKKTSDRYEGSISRDRLNIVRQQAANSRNLESARGAFKDDLAGGVRATIVADDLATSFKKRSLGTDSVDRRIAAVRNQAVSGWVTGVTAFHEKGIVFKSQNVAGMENMVRELFGEASGDATARKAAEEFARVSDWLAERFNAAGGGIAKREDWRLPQSHDAIRVAASTLEDWKAFVVPLLDRSRMLDHETGLPLSDDKLNFLLGNAYDSIRTHGYSDLVAGTGGGQRRVSDRHNDPRLLSFKDGDSWLAYHNKFGKGNPFNAVVDHFDRMSRDIALLEKMGPDPERGFQFLLDTANKEYKAAGKSFSESRIRNAWEAVSGQGNQPDGMTLPFTNRPVADLADSARQWITSATMGGAAIASAFGDPVLGAHARLFYDLPVTSLVMDYLRLLNPLDKSHRQFAAHLGLGAELWTSSALGARRFMATTNGESWGAKAANTVLSLSGLNILNQTGQHAFGLRFTGAMGEHVKAGGSFETLPEFFRERLTEHGVGPQEWALISKAELDTHRWAGQDMAFVRPMNVAKLEGGVEAASKLHSALINGMEMASPMGSAGVRSDLIGATRRGTLGGEMLRFQMMFKQFPGIVLNNHLGRAWANPAIGRKMGTWPARIATLGSFVAATTVAGAFTIQVRSLARGKDLANMDPTSEEGRKFWMSAMLQGGAFSFFGDIMQAASTSKGGRLLEYAGGPLATYTTQAAKAVSDLVEKNDPGQLVELGRKIQPGSNLWYTTLAAQRLVYDQIRAQVDPNAALDFRRMESASRRYTGQGFWWRPGQTAPERAPQAEVLGQ